MNVYEEVKRIGLVPVVVVNSVDEIKVVLDNLVLGDVRIAEVCYRTAGAPEALKYAALNYDNVLVGAGTIINREQCEDAISNGAKFIVSPGFSLGVCEVCKKYDIPYLPGIVTPTEIMMALDNGITTVKFFPAGVYGGLKAIKALSAAFPSVTFMPTGGVDNSNLREFISNPKIVACGGSWLIKKDSNEMINICKEARKIVMEVRNNG